MSTSPFQESVSQDSRSVTDKGNQMASTGLIISAIGFAGWLVMLAIFLFIPPEDSIAGSNNPLIELNNFLNYLLNLAVGLLGMSINGTLSITGTAISLSSRNQTASPKATSGLLLGIVGLAIGTGLVFWRMAVWRVFIA